MPTPSVMVPLGTSAPDFALRSIDDTTVRLDDFADAPALLVTFLSNHCPYVRHIELEFGKLIAEFPDLAVVGICSNDTENYPDDAPAYLREQRARAGWSFPYLVDSTQEVARAYQAACTPDFFLFDRDRKLFYRGQFDDSRPGKGVPTGADLRAAADALLSGKEPPAKQLPSIGCNIKWKRERA